MLNLNNKVMTARAVILLQKTKYPMRNLFNSLHPCIIE